MFLFFLTEKKYDELGKHSSNSYVRESQDASSLSAGAIIKMIYYDRVDVSEGIDVNKTSASKECDVCHYWYFLNFSFKFQPNVYNKCHDLLMMFVNLSDIAILNIKSSDYRCIITLIRKNEAINLMQNADLTEKAEHYKT